MKKDLKPINWIQWITLITVLALAITVPVIILQIKDQGSARSQAFRTLICYFEQQTLNDSQLPIAQKIKAEKIYSKALQLIKIQPCDLTHKTKASLK